MIVEDIFRVLDMHQKLVIHVMMQDEVNGTPDTFYMDWEGEAIDIPMRVMKTSVKKIGAFMDNDCYHTGELELYCEE